MAVTIRTSPGGPLLRSTVSPLRVTKDCFLVAMRDQRPGPTHGSWTPISRDGFLVVCASKLEACTLAWIIGGRHWPRPSGLDKGDDHDEERYLEWLLTHHLRIQPYRAGGPLEVMLSEFLKGWYPGAEDIPGVAGNVNTAAIDTVRQVLQARWEGR